MVEGVEYQIDITQPARFDGEGQLLNQDAHRIQNLTFNGQPVKDSQPFIIATNNYRSTGGGNFSGTGDDFVAFASPDENREVLSAYIRRTTKEKGQVTPKASNNWRIAPIQTDVKLRVVFETSPSEKAAAFIREHAVYKMEKVGYDDIGFALYQVDLTQQ